MDRDDEDFKQKVQNASQKVLDNYRNALNSSNPFSTCLSRRLGIRNLRLVNATHEVMIHVSGCKNDSASYLIYALVDYYPKHLFVYRSFNKVKIMIDKYSIMALVSKDSGWISLTLHPESTSMAASVIFGFVRMISCLPIDKYGRMYVDCYIHNKINSVLMMKMINKHINLAQLFDEHPELEYRCRKRPFLCASVRMDSQERFGFLTSGIFEQGRINFLNAETKSVIQNLQMFLEYLSPFCLESSALTPSQKNSLRSQISISNHAERGSLGAGVQYVKKSDLAAARKAEAKRILKERKAREKANKIEAKLMMKKGKQQKQREQQTVEKQQQDQDDFDPFRD